MIPGVTILATGIGTIVKRASRLATAQAVIASCALANSLGNLADEWTSAPFVNRPDHERIP